MDKISVVWWNVHQLRNETHAERVVRLLKEMGPPDVFALGEVIGEPAYQYVAKQFPDHNFYMTYGKQSQEFVLGVRRSFQAFLSQKTEFQSGNEFLRPAALLTISLGEPPLNILFVHLKSFTQPLSLGFRDDFFRRIVRFKHPLDQVSGGKSRFVICGDMNFQGMHYLEHRLLGPDDEFRHIQNELGDIGMLFAEKDRSVTWIDSFNRRGTADMDHVATTLSVQLVEQGKNKNGSSHVTVRGWPEFPEKSNERKEFIENVSDHAALYFEISL